MCCSGPSWKREVVPDHKFDFIDTRDFHSKAFGIRLQYVWIYILVIKSFLVYISDIYTATTMLTSTDWSNKIFTSCQEVDGCVAIPFDVAKWLFVGCIIFSFLLLAYEGHKAKKIIGSRDISFTFTNVMAQNYYSLRSYDHFCFFCHINDSTKKKDDFAFFIFFTFKGWKRLLLADGPRQTINALTLYSFYLSKKSIKSSWYDVGKYFDRKDMVTNGLLIAICFTVVIFAGSLFLLIIAGVMYVPLLCYIQGNLKEYCCHLVDKRISELVRRRQKQRIARQAQLEKKEAAGDFSHLKGQQNLPQPTLPTISLDDEDDLKKPPPGQRSYAASVRTANDSYWDAEYKDQGYNGVYMPDYPPMPAYDPYAYPPQPGYAASDTHLRGQDDSSLYDYNDHHTVKYQGGAQEPHSASAYSQDQYSRHTPDPYGRNNNTTGTGYDAAYNGAYAQQDIGQTAYGGYNSTEAQYGDAPAYQQDPYRAPSRNMLSRNNSRWADGGGGQSQGGYAY